MFLQFCFISCGCSFKSVILLIFESIFLSYCSSIQASSFISTFLNLPLCLFHLYVYFLEFPISQTIGHGWYQIFGFLLLMDVQLPKSSLHYICILSDFFPTYMNFHFHFSKFRWIWHLLSNISGFPDVTDLYIIYIYIYIYISIKKL